MRTRTNSSSPQNVPTAALTASDFSGDSSSPGVVVLGAHYVSAEDDAADSDSTRLRQFLLSTSIGRFCGVTYGDMAARPGFFKHNFKPGIPTSDAELVCLDYFWMQRGGDWIEMRYGNNWRTKIESSFSRCPQLKAFVVPKAFELFDDGASRSIDALELFATSGAADGQPPQPLSLSCIDAAEAESLHPLVVATLSRDRSRSAYIGRWETEGRVHSLQISRYAPEGFLIVHRFANDALLRDYLRGLCTPPPGLGVHPGMMCDVSGMDPIVGDRYHLIGEDWDLCEAEYLKLSEAEKAKYERIAPPVVAEEEGRAAMEGDAPAPAAATADDFNKRPSKPDATSKEGNKRKAKAAPVEAPAQSPKALKQQSVLSFFHKASGV